MNKNLMSALLLSTALLLSAPCVNAQNSSGPQVSVINLQVVRNADGSQSVVTPKGDLAPLPGRGVSGNFAPIYYGSQGGFWYTDASGQTIDLSATVEQLQARRAQLQRAPQVPQYAPQYQPEQQYQEQQQQQQQQQSSSSGGSGVGGVVATAAAAAGGAALGSMMTNNNYYNAPYGTPMRYGAGGSPYYYNNGQHRDVEDLSPNQKAVMYNTRQVNQNQQMQTQQNAMASRQSTQESRSSNQSARQETTGSNQQGRQQASSQNQANRQAQRGGGGQQEHFQKQQDWYSNQVSQNPGKFQQRGSENPFAAQGSSGFGERGQGARESRGSRETRQSGGRSGGREFSGAGGRRGGGGGRRR